MSTTIGLLAGFLTTGAWLPQLWRTWRSRSCDDISWAYLVAMLLGFVTWLTYGVLIGEPAIIVTNVVTLVLVMGLVALKARGAEDLVEQFAQP
jgi:MtN3 and saliva related transmembrane protein